MSDADVYESAWARAKVVRAKEHLEAFNEEFGRMDWRGDLRPLEVNMSLRFGDAIHCLRTSLDAMLWEIALATKGQPAVPNHASFPVVIDPAKWEKAAELLGGVVPEEVVERVREAQPFVQSRHHEQSHALWLLHQLDIQDKHRSAVAIEKNHVGTAILTSPDGKVTPGILWDPVVALPNGSIWNLTVVVNKLISFTEHALEHLATGAGRQDG